MKILVRIIIHLQLGNKKKLNQDLRLEMRLGKIIFKVKKVTWYQAQDSIHQIFQTDHVRENLHSQLNPQEAVVEDRV